MTATSIQLFKYSFYHVGLRVSTFLYKYMMMMMMMMMCSLVLSLQRLDVCLAVGLGDHVQKLASFLFQFRLVRLPHRVQYYNRT